VTARHRLIRVPASSANLGPGYDVLAAAVSLFLELEVEEAGEFSFDPGGLDVSTGRDNLIVRAFESLHSADGIAFRLRSEVPLARGLGSSAAAIVAGLYAADHLFELALSKEEMLARATELEGHPDNVAAALHGGVVVCADGIATRLEPPTGLEAVLVVPHEAVRTREARAALPAKVPMADAVANVAHASLLMLGLAQGDWDLVGRGLVDRLHQPYRASLFPRSMDIVARAPHLGALGATISGAGPTVLVWCHYEQTGGVLEALRREAEGWADVLRAPFESQGADVRALY
jgi:homoserine kinase